MLKFSQPVQIDEYKSVGDDWEVSGYVSVFNNVDLGDDIVLPGAFKKSLKSGRKVRFLMAHDPAAVLGVAKVLKEDSKGLFGQFKISKTKLGEETHQLLQDGAIDSFSFGYNATDFDIRDGGVRELKAVDLYEASLVSIPMNPEAVVTGMKDYLSLLGIEGELPITEKTRLYIEGLKQLFENVRGIPEKGQPLTEAKRKELADLLETFSGLDAVRAELQTVLTVPPTGLVQMRRVKTVLAEKRKLYGQPENKE